MSNNSSNRRRARRTRRAFLGACFVALTSATLNAIGCKTLNEDPRNQRIWFPTLAPPTKKEREMRNHNFPEGGDPYVDANVGPRSFDTRPRGWTDQRAKTHDVTNTYPDVYYD